jgi:hypothetical protein
MAGDVVARGVEAIVENSPRLQPFAGVESRHEFVGQPVRQLELFEDHFDIALCGWKISDHVAEPDFGRLVLALHRGGQFH